MDPLTLALVSFGITVFIQILALTLEKLVNWFRSKRRITDSNKDAIGVVLAQRLNDRDYVTVPGVFGNRSAKTQLVQAIYDTASQKIVDARAVTSTQVKDTQIADQVRAGNGMLVFT
jgi:hypothetical protein